MRVWSSAVPACALAVLALSHHACRAQDASTETRTGADYDQTSVAGPHHRILPARGGRSTGAGAAGSGSIVEIGGGLNYFDGGQWQPSRAEFVPVEGGVHAVTGQHKVRLASSLLTPGCVDFTTPEGVPLPSNVLGLR